MTETFSDYFERQIQLTSTIWSCEYTGKSGLTFFEALESEKNAIVCRALYDFDPIISEDNRQFP